MNTGIDEKILNEIIRCSLTLPDPAGRSVKVIHEAVALQLTDKYDRTLKDIYQASLSVDIWPYRYVRNFDTLTAGEQQKLGASCVAVIGCGGLGGYVLQMLARIGIGSLITVDPDCFDESNLNRQAFAVSDTIGIPKTTAAANSIQSINPAVTVIEYQTAISHSNAAQIIHDADVLVDALDNIPDRKMIVCEANHEEIPVVHGAIAGFEGQVMTIIPNQKDTGDSGLFGQGDGYDYQSDMNAEAVMGVPSITPVFIASLQAMEVVKILLKRGNRLSRRMLYSDIEAGDFNFFEFKT